MSRDIEILAPAGNMEALKAAVFSGADAVYLGGSLFSARASAVNFSDEELKEAVSFCHIRGVKVYVTVNTLIKDSEMSEALSFVRFLCEISVDGILVQDMGLFRILNEMCPDMPLHASTQMSVFSPEAARMLSDMGADRIVLAREMSLQEIKEIHDAVDTELEVFVHGAMCMSVSGQCYFSAMLGSRSGNRGRCAQPCRLPFTTRDGFANVLSLKDLDFTEKLDMLRKVGVCSAKIEGRMKRPEYVAASVSAAGKAADGEKVPQQLLDNLEAVFSRSGFSSAYLEGKTGPAMFGIRTKEDVTAGSSGVFAGLHELYKGEANRVPADIEFEIKANKRAVIRMSDRDGNSVRLESSSPVEKALNRPLSSERIEEQLRKLGPTPYHAENVSVNSDGESTMPMSQINALRRDAAERLNSLRAERKAVPCSDEAYDFTATSHRSDKLKLEGVFDSFSQVPDNAAKLDCVYLPLTGSMDDFLNLRKKLPDVRVNMPRAFFGAEKEVEEKMRLLMENGFVDFLCPNLASLALAKKLGARIHGGFSLNIFNTEAVKTFEKLELVDTELSWELTLDEAAKLGGELPRGLMAYGRQALMLTRACPIGHGNCLGCRDVKCITDRKGIDFPVMCMRGRGYRSTEVLNSVALNMCDRLDEFKNMDFLILRFTDEKKDMAEAVIEDFIAGGKPRPLYTRGLYYRGVI